MATLLVTVVCVLPAFAQSDEAAKRFHVLPHIADGDGWQSSLLVTNVSPLASPCTLQLFGGLGVERFEAASGVTAAGSTATFSLAASSGHLVWHTRNESAETSGYATLECDNPVVAQVVFARIGSAGTPTGMATVFSSQTATAFQFPVLTPAGTLAVAIANDAHFEASCLIVLKDLQGTTVGEEAMLSVPMKSNHARFLNQAIQIPEDFTGGSAAVSCDQQVAVIGLHFELRSDGSIVTFNTLPPAVVDPSLRSSDETARSFHVLPHIADGGGWQSSLLVTNVSPSASPCTLQLYGGLSAERFETDSGVTAAGLTATFSLAESGGHLVWRTRNELAEVSGYATLDCVQPVVAQVVFARIGSAGTPTGMATVFSSQAWEGFQLPVLTPAGTLALAIANDTHSGASCRIVLEDPQGQRLGESALSVPAKSNVARMLNAAVAIPEGFRGGTARVVCDQPVSVIGLHLELGPFGGIVTFNTLRPAMLDVVRPTATLSASPSTTEFGETTLTWSSTNAVSAVITPDIGEVEPTGSREVSLNSTTTFRITVTTVDGVRATATTTVTLTAPRPGSAASDRAALEALYEATVGPDWVNNDNWLTDAPLGEWYGVETGPSGRVVRIELAGQGEGRELVPHGLQGPIPPELGDLTSLEVLDLHGNSLTGTIPLELGRLRNLQELHLGDNGLYGHIPPELGLLRDLRSLRLRVNLLTGSIPPTLGKLTKLELLYLEHNSLEGAIPPDLGDLSELREMWLNQNKLEGPIPSQLGRLSRLIHLSLSWNRLTGPIPPELGNLARLWNLGLNGNELTGPIPPELGNLSSLGILSLGNNSLTGPIPPWLATRARLRSISLHGNALTGPIPPELGRLPELESLLLSGNQLTGPIPPELGNLNLLERLDVRGNRLSGPVPPELGNLQRLVEITLGDTLLTGSIPQTFLGLANLATLDCQRTEYGVCLPATDAFREWAREVEFRGGVQRAIDIPWCDEIDKGALKALYEATNGSGWTNSGGWLEDENLGRWYGVRTDSIGRITGLDLSGNGLSGQVPDALGRLATLTELRIGSNELAGRLPLPLAQVRLEALDYSGTSLCVPDNAGFRAWLGGIPRHSGTGKQCGPLTEREVLEGLYRNTEGPSWSESGGWLTAAALAEWEGVETDASGRVVALRLGGRGLAGSLPENLGELSELRELDLSGNRFSGSIPPELWGLGSLQSLRLGSNQLNGGIPPELGQLSELRELDLGRNRFSGSIPPQLGGLDSLQTLRLGSNQLSGGIPPELGRLSELRYLALAGNLLSGPIPPQLGGLGRLRSLLLEDNQLSGGIPPELGQLSELRDLELSDNQLTGHIPPQLGTLAGLSLLDLSGNDLTGPIPSVLGRLANLRHLRLFDNYLWGTIPATLGNLEQLVVLSLGDNDLSGPLPAKLGSAAKLEDLDLRGNALAGPVPPEVGNLMLMKSLILADNPELTGPLPAGVTALGQLERFMAGGTGLCRPADAQFDAWFRGIADRRLVRCEGGATVYLAQAVQSWDDPVPLVAGEPALLRVFVTMRQGTATLPDVRATFYVDDAVRHTVHIPASTQTIPSVVMEDDLALSANAEVPGWVIVPGLEMVIEVDPEGMLDPALGVRKRLPEAGRMAVDVQTMPPLHLTLVPLLHESDSDSSIVESVQMMAADPDGHALLADVRTLLPVTELAVTAHEPVTTSFRDPHRLIREINAMRIMEGGSGYWMGIIQPPPRTGGTNFYYLLPIGVATTGGTASVAIREPAVIAHELGHNLALQHAPCGAPDSIDPWFPYPGGNTGAWGYDFMEKALVTPQTPDLMSYCKRGGYWISDFFFNKALRHRLVNEGASAAELTATADPVRSLLVWGGRDEHGLPFLDPAFVDEAAPSLPVADGEYTIKGRTADGISIFSFPFDMPVTADAEGEATSFVLALPVQAGWGNALASITLSGPGGSATLDKNTDRPMAILRDPQTGRVRGFLRDPLTPAQSPRGRARVSPAQGLEVIRSRGLPDAAAWQR